ncbi:ERI1 exoribonuclease 2 [Liparis tanakae]|uniref:ERI1 exoribonuclease 2 n=1 Tax=Liparis tanakae TaxID=230148 RepID=A0A4Z2FY61_9TELE|nr:ERI1 exoribonuclease 2 [Liparis tanakae]
MSTKKLAKELGLLRQRSQSSDGSKKPLLSIEFPAVVMNTSTGEIESEFHTYVQPQEHPILSEFCTELTGITQIQVEAGIPLQIALSRFGRWLQTLQRDMGLVFPSGPQGASAPSQKQCAFVTWSDWDLGVCLLYECKRKQLHKPDVLNSWIDLRITYRLFYDRKPKGLNGALQDLGIQFSGREHSGLDDSRNTAQLAARMMRDGCVMKITRSLEKVPPESCRIESCRIESCPENISRDSDPERSLISPKTLLNGTTTPLWGCGGGSSVKAAAVANSFSSVMMNRLSLLINNNNNNNNNGSLVLYSTTLGRLSNLPPTNRPSDDGATVEEDGAELFVETEDGCCSYDDVVLEGGDDGDDDVGETEGEFDVDFDGGCHEWGKRDEAHSSRDQVTLRGETRDAVSDGEFKTQKMSGRSSTSHHFNTSRQHSTIPEPSAYFAVPKAVAKPNGPHNIPKADALSLLRHNPFIPVKTSTPHTSFVRPKAVVPKSSFAIFADSAKPSRPAPLVPLCASKNVLSSLSTNALAHRSSAGGQRTTAPLCGCGRRARRQAVSNGGPNQGRGFYCCPVRRSGGGGGGRIQKGCEFFKWESALMRSGSGAVPAAGSSVSLCQINSTLTRPAQQRATLRKSY